MTAPSTSASVLALASSLRALRTMLSCLASDAAVRGAALCPRAACSSLSAPASSVPRATASSSSSSGGGGGLLPHLAAALLPPAAAGLRGGSGGLRALPRPLPLPHQAQQHCSVRCYAAAGGRRPAGAGNGSGSSSRGGGGSSNSSSDTSSSSSSRPAEPAKAPPVLLTVPGIGRAYVDRLAAQGINSVDALASNILQQLSAAELSEAFAPAVKYLQGLGIRRQDHAQRIVHHITAAYDRDLHARLVLSHEAAAAAAAVPGGPDVTLCVEGNISAGKSTFLQYITAGNEELQHTLGVVHEPVDKWQCVPTVAGGTLNLLDKFYSDPPKYAYSFQNYVFMSRVMQERDSASLPRPVRLMERSVFSDRMVFVRAVSESGWMGDVEVAVYDSWFGGLLGALPQLVPDGFIYLKCEPATCMERLKLRGRSEETTITMDYLEGLHAKHEDWLGAGQGLGAALIGGGSSSNSSSSSGSGGGGGGYGRYAGAGGQHELLQQLQRRRRSRAAAAAGGPAVVASPGGLLLPAAPSPLLADSLFFLDRASAPQEMQPCLHRVPALILDCNADVLRDMDLQRQVQDTVAEYIRFMRDAKEARAAAASAGGGGAGSGGGRREQQQGRRLGGGQRIRVQPGGPEGVQLAVTEMVQEAARGVDEFRLVAQGSGVLQQPGEAAAAAVSGSLEALQVASAAAAEGAAVAAAAGPAAGGQGGGKVLAHAV